MLKPQQQLLVNEHLNPKFTFISELLSKKILKVTVKVTDGSDLVYIGQFKGFNAGSQSTGLLLMNAVSMHDGRVWPSCEVASVEKRNSFDYTNIEHTCEMQADNTLWFNNIGTLRGATERVIFSKVTVQIVAQAYNA